MESNLGLTSIWLVAVIIFLIIVVVTVLAIKKWEQNNSILVVIESNKCTPEFSTLPDVSSLLCCQVNGLLTPEKYYSAINMVISTAASPFLDACSGFCTNGVSSSNSSECNRGIGQDNYSQCLLRLKPNGCVGISNPVARVDTTYYYGVAAGELSCPIKISCTPS